MGQGFLFILLLLVAASASIPLASRRKRIKREDENISNNMTIPLDVCMLDNETYKRGQEVPSLGPCEKCVCEAPDVVCSMIKCRPNSGCRITQQSGQCCPEYKCDCEYNGIIYNNGEKLDKPEDPCQVCYCKGGEIMCTSITCYERDDCKPLYTAGQCCPKYDHCPIENSRASGNSVRSVNTSLYSPKREMQPWPLTRSSNLPTSVSYDESSASPPNVYPQTIRIVEILPTTPGYIKKPSEVSVIPRIKTNNHSESKEAEETTKVASSTAESSTEFSSSTSEIEHLLDTTPEVKVEEKVASTVEAHDSSPSTLNPLAESVDLNTLPDSYRFSTIYPNYYYTEGSGSSLEDETTHIWNEPEGSGFEILTGGVYEEISTSAASLTNEETTTENGESVMINEQGIKEEEPLEKISDFPTFETFTTEPPVVEEFDNNNSNIKIEEGSFPTFALSSEKESVESVESVESENSSESSIEDNYDGVNGTSLMDIENLNNQSLITQDLKNNSSQRLMIEEKLDEGAPSSVEVLENATTTSSDLYDGTQTVTKKSGTETTITENISITTTTEEAEIASTQPSEIYLLSQAPDELANYGKMTERKRASVGNYRNLDSDVSTIGDYLYGTREQSSKMEDTPSSPSSISFPPVLNVHTLDYSEMNPQVENKTNHNTSSMAKVGIYHPTKPNELASFLTVVDDKSNVSSFNSEKIPSHILLTPNDLKKLAEILIHEKIMPAYPETSTDKSGTDFAETYPTPGSTVYSTIKSNVPRYKNVLENEEDLPYQINDTSVEKALGESTKDVVNSSLLMDIDESIPQKVSSDHEALSATRANEESTVTRQPEITENNSQYSAEIDPFKGITTSQDEMLRNFVSTVSGMQKQVTDNVNDDPNISRQIRITENGNQYSSLLDDKDLVILQNFFKKNMGMH